MVVGSDESVVMCYMGVCGVEGYGLWGWDIWSYGVVLCWCVKLCDVRGLVSLRV